MALAERLQRQGDLLGAAKMYSEVKGDAEFTFTAKFKAAECYYKILVGAAATKDNKTAPKIDTDQLRKLAVADLNESIKMGHEAEAKANTPAAKNAVREIRGEATYMLASILEEDQDHVDYAQVAPLLVGYETNYPMMSAKFQDVVDWRITALDHLGRYDEVNTDVATLVERSKSDTAKQDFVKGLGIEFWKTAQAAKDNNDQKAYLANAKLTATAYKGFAEMAASGKIPVKNLTGTLSIYAQALQATGNEDEANKVFEEVVKADPASPDANAGLARQAQAKGDWKDANERWTAVENTAAESDPLWYEAKFQLAVIYSKQGNVQAACSKLAQTRAEHPTLGSRRNEGQVGQGATLAVPRSRGQLAAMLKKIHHVGVVVPNLDAGLKFWRDTLGLHFTKSATIEEQGVRAALLKAGESEIELLEPLDPENAVGKFLARRGGGLHHVCFETDDVARELDAARAKGIQLIDQKPRHGLAGMICFLHPKATRGVLVEYAQPPARIRNHADLRIPMRQMRPLIRGVRAPRRRSRMPALSRLQADARDVHVRGAREQWRRRRGGRVRDGQFRHVERFHRWRRMLRRRLRLPLTFFSTPPHILPSRRGGIIDHVVLHLAVEAAVAEIDHEPNHQPHEKTNPRYDWQARHQVNAKHDAENRHQRH